VKIKLRILLKKASMNWDQLLDVQGLSGRSLRKLPFLAHAALADPYSHDPSNFLCTMIETAKREKSEQPE
jgi:hypothetical protein